MADLIIRGMKMPGNCRKCGFAGFGGIRSELNVCMFSGESQSLLSHERMSKCPLVPLPEGHGRLIDADALLSVLDILKDKGCDGPIWDQMRDIVENMVTIVPAEGGKEHD